MSNQSSVCEIDTKAMENKTMSDLFVIGRLISSVRKEWLSAWDLAPSTAEKEWLKKALLYLY